jgi:hypothetical protein
MSFLALFQRALFLPEFDNFMRWKFVSIYRIRGELANHYTTDAVFL